MNITKQLQSGRRTWILVDSLAGSGVIAEIKDWNTRVVTKEDLKNDPSLRFEQGDNIIISTETVLDDVLQRLDDPEKKDLILTCPPKSGSPALYVKMRKKR